MVMIDSFSYFTWLFDKMRYEIFRCIKSLTFMIIYGLVKNLYNPLNLVTICGILFIDNL